MVKEQTEIMKPVRPNTIAKSIAIGNPADGYYAAETCRKSGGWAEDVTDEEVVEGMSMLAKTEGIFTETAGGVTVAVLKKLAESRQMDPDELVVVYVTGNGLKTQEALVGALNAPYYVRPTLRSVEEALGLAAPVASLA